MGKIAVLDDETIGHIAAGEVVERPLSVLKELVENALDAGATAVTVEVADGGRDLLKVGDDGEGMDAADLALSVVRHATSKLARADDLRHVGTLGFRGEALASIAAVSRLEIRTRRSGEVTGHRLVAEGGNILALEENGCPPGTWISVQDLFYNTPARKSFLPSVRTERANLVEMAGAFSLLNPRVSFRLLEGGRALLAAPGGGSYLEAAVAVHGPEVAASLRPVSGRGAGMEVSGLVAGPEVSRAGRSGQALGVNGRWVQSYQLRLAAENAYIGTLPGGRRPIFCLSVRVPPEEVDVNVHPTKQEIRFRRLREVQGLVYRACREALTGGVGGMAVIGSPRRFPTGAGTTEGVRTVGGGVQRTFTAHEPSLTAGATPERVGSGYGWRPDLPRVIGQLCRSYILAEVGGFLWVVDQHAAHERVYYEAFAAEPDQTVAQRLLVPLTVEMPPVLWNVWENWGEEIAACGFLAEPFGPKTLLVRCVPAGLAGLLDGTGFLDLLEHLSQGGAGEEPSGRRDRLFRRMAACRAAVKAKDELSLGEMNALLEQLSRCRDPHTCPHGRPLLVKLPVEDLARRMGR